MLHIDPEIDAQVQRAHRHEWKCQHVHRQERHGNNRCRQQDLKGPVHPLITEHIRFNAVHIGGYIIRRSAFPDITQQLLDLSAAVCILCPRPNLLFKHCPLICRHPVPAQTPVQDLLAGRTVAAVDPLEHIVQRKVVPCNTINTGSVIYHVIIIADRVIPFPDLRHPAEFFTDKSPAAAFQVKI